MKKISHQAAAVAIVTAGLASMSIASTPSYDGSSVADSAPILFDESPITQHTCAQLYVRDVGYHATPNRGEVSERLYEPPAPIDYSDYSSEVMSLVQTLNDADFDTGHLSITDCVGSARTVDVRLREFTLDDIQRQSTEPEGWRFSAESENYESKIFRIAQLELPPAHAWTVNSRGDGLIALEHLFHINNDNDANIGYYRRIRITEVTHSGNDVLVKQRFSINDRFSELQTWTLDN